MNRLGFIILGAAALPLSSFAQIVIENSSTNYIARFATTSAGTTYGPNTYSNGLFSNAFLNEHFYYITGFNSRTSYAGWTAESDLRQNVDANGVTQYDSTVRTYSAGGNTIVPNYSFGISTSAVVRLDFTLLSEYDVDWSLVADSGSVYDNSVLYSSYSGFLVQDGEGGLKNLDTGVTLAQWKNRNTLSSFGIINNNSLPGDTSFRGRLQPGRYQFHAFSNSYIERGNTNNELWTGLRLRQSLSLTPVPEPATMAALGLGAAALLRRRRLQS